MHVEGDAGRLGVPPEGGRAARIVDPRTLPALRIAEEELAEPGAAGPRLGDRVGGVDMGTHRDHDREPNRRDPQN